MIESQGCIDASLMKVSNLRQELDVAEIIHFKASTGFAPHQYVIQRRIERAKLLLSTTNWSLTTIAHAVGFAHESHLALHFKRLTGLLPSASR